MTNLTARKSDYILTTTYNDAATRNRGARNPAWNDGGTSDTLGLEVPRQSGFLLRAEQDELVDSYPVANASAELNIYTGLRTIVGQSFAGDDGNLSKALFSLKKSGSPTGTAVVTLYEHSGTFGTSSVPTGSALATSSTLDVSTLTTSLVTTTFTFPYGQNVRLYKGVNYCICIEYSGGSASNYVIISTDNTSPSASGNAFTYLSSWVVNATDDVIFYVYAGGLSARRILTNTGDYIILASTR